MSKNENTILAALGRPITERDKIRLNFALNLLGASPVKVEVNTRAGFIKLEGPVAGNVAPGREVHRLSKFVKEITKKADGSGWCVVIYSITSEK